MLPILLNSCARAASAEEARFRIDGPLGEPRLARVVALDSGAERIVRATASEHWSGAHFYLPPAFAAEPDPLARAFDAVSGNGHRHGNGNDPALPLASALVIEELGGASVGLDDLLEEADIAVLVATADDGAAFAEAIGGAASARGVMTAGVIFGDRETATVAALRPQARVLLISSDERDLADLLSALRA